MKTALKRQFITDTEGKKIGVILPLAEYKLVESLLEEQLQLAAQISQMEMAAQDPLFMEDLKENMAVFSQVDAEWWEAEK